MMGDLHMKNCPAPDYSATRCSGQDCPHKQVAEAKVGDKTFRKVSTIPCVHYCAVGEPAALWARVSDWQCPHFVEAVL